ncbi:MAG TPA: DUF1345 domain-containing protein [Reyranella sp.]|nr:DUF1345 domain-containing protein [Reyranella sp.]
MAKSTARTSRLQRMFLLRRRLLGSVVIGVVLFLLLPQHMRLSTRALLGWDLTALLYIGMVFHMIGRSTVETCHRRAALYDEGDWVITLLIVGSAATSFIAIFSELAKLKSSGQLPLFSLGLTGATVVLGWTFTHVIFTMHYANLYYRPSHHGPPGGLEFPGDRDPDYRDFLYYAFVIGCAAQTADVNTVSPEMRRITLIHGIVAFAFNTALLALTINVGASLLS